jgi:thiamine-phosphate pyrophosphorylase
VIAAFTAIYRERDIDQARRFMHPDIVLDWSESLGPYRGVYRGHGETEAFFREFAESFDSLDWNVIDTVELGDRLAIGTKLTVRGEGSGVQASSAGGQVWEFDDRLVREIKLLQSRDEAVREMRRRRLEEARLYFVCDAVAGVGEILDAALTGGADVIQLREKSPRCAEELVSLADPFRRAATRHGALFLINDRPDLVSPVGADGVHVGQDDAPVAEARAQAGDDSLVGLSSHEPAQLDAVEAMRGAGRPDYVSVGPVWETPTKEGRPAAGLDYVRYAAERASMPWFAIGGIDASNIDEVTGAGAARVVVVRAIRDAADPTEVARTLRAALPNVSNYEKVSLSESNS